MLLIAVASGVQIPIHSLDILYLVISLGLVRYSSTKPRTLSPSSGNTARWMGVEDQWLRVNACAGLTGSIGEYYFNRTNSTEKNYAKVKWMRCN